MATRCHNGEGGKYRVVRDAFSAELIRLAIEQYGSEAHLARALVVTREALHAWSLGEGTAPPAVYQALADILAQKK